MEIITREQADEAMKPIWEIKEKIYEETKNMTREEKNEYIRQNFEAGLRQMAEIKPGECDLSFLYEKKDDENQSANSNQNENAHQRAG